MSLSLDQDIRGGGGVWAPPGIGDRFSRIGASGASFGRGMLRFHDARSGPAAAELVSAALPELVGVTPIAFDWLGREFVVSGGQVFLVDPGEMSVGELCPVDSFLAVLQTPQILQLLRIDLFTAFLRSNGLTALGFEQCAALQVPVFLSGTLESTNLELSDVSVYWTLFGQLWTHVKGLPDGAAVRGLGQVN